MPYAEQAQLLREEIAALLEYASTGRGDLLANAERILDLAGLLVEVEEDAAVTQAMRATGP